ncbi:MAG: hypothetical protein QOI11_3870 [Candidatus Eremiobacteraeota bacterium]|jgi:hypothetical protein|nr:hypothetical protein [Candidatus Eremiobacteraeota bacterium]
MNSASDSRRLTGALQFLSELHAFAAECAATGIWDDELTARRRQREDARTGADIRQGEKQVKAL